MANKTDSTAAPTTPPWAGGTAGGSIASPVVPETAAVPATEPVVAPDSVVPVVVQPPASPPSPAEAVDPPAPPSIPVDTTAESPISAAHAAEIDLSPHAVIQQAVLEAKKAGRIHEHALLHGLEMRLAAVRSFLRNPLDHIAFDKKAATKDIPGNVHNALQEIADLF